MIDTNGYKVIYDGAVFNCLSIDFLQVSFYETSETGIKKAEMLSVIIIDSDNNVSTILDEAWKFQFVREVKKV
jgi:hypothetical protein